ncbi:LCP family protein [Patulibacter brassicae]|uniref:LCP family protein n=1 Tax=Patulibacter brassicae TaxID=1705717 RepID=A0ABU4VHY8_9ACTN|nr:LCP family protein [Patulibacter brassicae]MDX8151437.1 LCP family protein [Patulibacter brassicae]
MSSLSVRPPRPGIGFGLRILLAGIVVLAFAGAAVATTVENEAKKSIEALDPERTQVKGLEGVLADVEPGKPQTVLLVGDDRRLSDDKSTPTRSDTMILLRLDPDANATTMLSLPRDLLIDLGGGRQKLNDSYTRGPRQLIRTIQTMLSTPGEEFLIHHYVSIRFGAFSRAVNFFGCFYADIDRKYFNPPNSGYAKIDVPSGYQRMCGEDSLDYVRFRHTDSDLVREARQTNYLAEARAQIANSKLLGERNNLLRAINRYIKTDIGTPRGLLGVVRLAVDVAGKPTSKVKLQVADAGDRTNVVTTPAALARAARQFLHPASVPGRRAREARDEAAKTGARPARRQARRKKARTPDSLFANPMAARQAIQQSDIVKDAQMPVYYPSLMTKRGNYRAQDSRGYDIRSPGGRTYPWRGYRIVVADPGVGQYYGVQGLTWDDPPILKLADDEERIGGRTWLVQYDGKQIRRLMWTSGRGTYWISNTLSNELTNAEMRALARSFTRYSS